MSHPIPGQEYNNRPDEEYFHVSKNFRKHMSKHKSKAIKKALEGGMVGKLKKMIKEPASKEWFKKHGMPKGSRGYKHNPHKEDFNN